MSSTIMLQHIDERNKNVLEGKVGNKMVGVCQKKMKANTNNSRRGSIVIIFLSGMAFATFLQAFLSTSSSSSSSNNGTTTSLLSLSTTTLPSSSFLKGSRIPKKTTTGRRGVEVFTTEKEEDEKKKDILLRSNNNQEEAAEEERNEKTTVASCGLFYFYHVGKCGGTSVSKWMKKLTKANPNELEFYNWWHQSNNTEFDWRVDYNDIDTKLRSGYITPSSSNNNNNSNNKKKNWLMVHHHHGAPGLRYMMPKLYEWKQLLENQNQGSGCKLILTTTLRDPLSRAKSVVQYRNLPQDEFYSFFQQQGGTGGGGYSSQTSYLLYNRYVKNIQPEFTGQQQRQQQQQQASSSSSLSSSDDDDNDNGKNVVVVDEIVNYLKEFDIVGRTENLDDFISNAETKYTNFDQLKHTKGLVKGKALKSNKSHASYDITSDMEDYLKPYLVTDQLLLERVFFAESGEEEEEFAQQNHR